MKKTLKNLFEFTKFTHSFQKIKRRVYVTGESRDENDLEHSGQLALVAWYLIDSEKLKLNKEKVIKYALAHDLVETYAGDTYFYSTNKKLVESKVQREKDALKRILKEHPGFKELKSTIEEFEERKNPEAKFVYALDKVIPVLNIYLDHGRSWRRDKVKLEMIRKYKDEKIALAPELIDVWKDLVKILAYEEKKLFG